MTGTSDTAAPATGENDIVINRPKEGEFYRLDIEVGGPEHGVVFENEDDFLALPDTLQFPEGSGFPPLKETPRLRQTVRDQMVRDLDSSFGGYWLVSAALKRVFESVDPEGFAFAPCEFILADGSQGSPYYLCDVLRTIDAVDEKSSKVKIELDDDFPKGKYYSMSGGARLAFKRQALGSAHVFRTPFNSQLVICDHVLRDALIEHGFGKEPNTRGVSLEDVSAYGIYGISANYWPENK